MKVLVLAGGYGTRLARDLEAEGALGQYAHLRGVPKPLLPVGGIPLISHWLTLLRACPDTQGAVYIVVRGLVSYSVHEHMQCRAYEHYDQNCHVMVM